AKIPAGRVGRSPAKAKEPAASPPWFQRTSPVQRFPVPASLRAGNTLQPDGNEGVRDSTGLPQTLPRQWRSPCTTGLALPRLLSHAGPGISARTKKNAAADRQTGLEGPGVASRRRRDNGGTVRTPRPDPFRTRRERNGRPHRLMTRKVSTRSRFRIPILW